MHHHCITASALVAVCLAVVGVVVPHVAAFAPPPLLSSSSSMRRRSSPPRAALADDSDSAASAPPKKKQNMGMTDAELIEIADSVDTRWVCPSYLNICEEEGVTLSRYMMEMVRANPELEEIQSIFTSLQVACKTLSNLVRTSALTGITGAEGGGGSINIQGEEQKKLDIISNDIMKDALKWSGQLATLASEEEDTPVGIEVSAEEADFWGWGSDSVILDNTGRYVAVFDPLDGSSNVDAGIPVGTIFGIFEQSECDIEEGIDFSDGIDADEEKCLADTLQPGNNLVAAGYCLYSSATSFVFTIGSGVYGFTLDERIGEFVLTHPDMKIPNRGKIYSFNEANRWDWDRPMQQYVTDIQQGLGDTKTKYSSRYIGSMVGDVHRTLQYGGIFGYPADRKNQNGKLRLLYEAAPMAFLLEQAGGLALTGKNRIMNIPPSSVHQRVPCILGSRDDVLEMRRYYVQSDDPELIARCKDRLTGSQLDKVTTDKGTAQELTADEQDIEDSLQAAASAVEGEFGAAQ